MSHSSSRQRRRAVSLASVLSPDAIASLPRLSGGHVAVAPGRLLAAFEHTERAMENAVEIAGRLTRRAWVRCCRAPFEAEEGASVLVRQRVTRSARTLADLELANPRLWDEVCWDDVLDTIAAALNGGRPFERDEMVTFIEREIATNRQACAGLPG